MDKKRILIIEDESSIADILSYSLMREGYITRCELNGKSGIDAVEAFSPDLIILDVMLPDISGFDVCSILTSKHSIPVIMLTARNDIVDKVLGLELGADDYITKPFDIREVAARVKVALRRLDDTASGKGSPEEVVWINNIKIDKSSRTVFRNDREIRLKPREYDLLITFSDNKNRVLTREQLLDIVWDIDYEGDLRTVDVHVQRLRKKLDGNDGQSIIDTVFGVGYKMRCQE